MSAAPARYALYFPPATAHPLWRAGCDWLGRADMAEGGPARPDRASAWRYGFHATLKAPMALHAHQTEEVFLAAVRQVAAQHAPFELPHLQVAVLDGFLALRPVQEPTASHPLRRLADDCVRQLDCFRAPWSAAEQARQLQRAPTPLLRANVQALGYAFVLDDWRFHMTLSDVLPDLSALRRDAEQHFAAALAQPLVCDGVCVFVEPAAGAPFALRHRVPLGAA